MGAEFPGGDVTGPMEGLDAPAATWVGPGVVVGGWTPAVDVPLDMPTLHCFAFVHPAPIDPEWVLSELLVVSGPLVLGLGVVEREMSVVMDDTTVGLPVVDT